MSRMGDPDGPPMVFSQSDQAYHKKMQYYQQASPTTDLQMDVQLPPFCLVNKYANTEILPIFSLLL